MKIYSKGIPERTWCSESPERNTILGLVNKLETTGSLGNFSQRPSPSLVHHFYGNLEHPAITFQTPVTYYRKKKHKVRNNISLDLLPHTK
ncbi:hypothetical protein C0J52_13732 [Blattella germanica]|nr:hypothetical protein C0J52_13732 [Blattella germanica]